MKRKFITFEGPEGSGKTTQLLLLAKYLKEKGRHLVVTREPGGTEISEKLRNILLDASNLHLCDRTELLLILSSRAQNTEEVILPALEEDKIVLCDRYSDSTLAYQSFGRGFDLEQTRRMCLFATNGLQPGLTFLLDIDPRTGLERATASARTNKVAQAHDRIEAQGLDFHRKVRKGFLALAGSEPERFRVLDGREPIDEIHAKIATFTMKIIDAQD